MIEKFRNINLLYVEDDINTVEIYLKTFELIFKKVYVALSFDEAKLKFKDNEDINLVIIDINLNYEKTGFDIAKEIKNINENIAVIFLTGLSESENILKAINSNMNGYLIKPLNFEDFSMVLSNLFKEDKIYINLHGYKYNLLTLELFDTKSNKVNLGKKENQLLQFFIKNKGKTLSREVLEDKLWNRDSVSDSHLKNIIFSLRKKIGKNIITNESKLGWRLNLE